MQNKAVLRATVGVEAPPLKRPTRKLEAVPSAGEIRYEATTYGISIPEATVNCTARWTAREAAAEAQTSTEVSDFDGKLSRHAVSYMVEMQGNWKFVGVMVVSSGSVVTRE